MGSLFIDVHHVVNECHLPSITSSVGDILCAGPAVFCGMRIFTLRRGIRHLPRNLLIAMENAKLPIFAAFISRSKFFVLLLLLPFIKQ